MRKARTKPVDGGGGGGAEEKKRDSKKSDNCAHSTVICEMCAECGADLRKLTEEKQMVSMVHSVPGLRVSVESARKIAKHEEDSLLKNEKLILLVDLDQTLIHTTNEEVPADLPDVFHFQLPGHGHHHHGHNPWYHTRLRPLTRSFLAKISLLYELHICTFGSRAYANAVAKFIDPEGGLFSDRILSRDECFSQNSKTANLKELFPRGDHMVCIIDDREDVWNHAPNLIHVKPYHFFKHTGDINAPPGLGKRDLDVDDDVESTSKKAAIASEEKSGGGGGDVIEEETSEEPSRDEEKADDDEEHLSDDDEVVEKDLKDGAGEDEGAKEVREEETTKNEQNEVKDVDVVTTSTNTEEKEPVSGEKEVVNKSTSTTAPEPPTQKAVVEDPDDYLLYLEQILKQIHDAFFTLYRESGSGGGAEKSIVPDVKNVIPYVRRKVLKNTTITFSGLIPTETPPHVLPSTRPYKIATSLGAQISERIVIPTTCSTSSTTADATTTHLVAARLGTAKVNEARKLNASSSKTMIKIVNPDWLWTCAERWERCEERLFEVVASASASSSTTKQKPSGSRKPPVAAAAALRKERTPSGRFDYNPLLSFSNDEILSMGHEVDDILSEDSSSSSGSSDGDGDGGEEEGESDNSSSSSSTTKEEVKQCSSSKKRPHENNDRDGDEEDEDEDDIRSKFRRNSPLPDDVDIASNSDDEDDNGGEDEEWMAEQLEKEFLNE